MIILGALVGATLIVCFNWVLWSQLVVNYLMEVSALSKAIIDQGGRSIGGQRSDVANSSRVLKQSLVRRGLRNPEVHQRGDLEEGQYEGDDRTQS